MLNIKSINAGSVTINNIESINITITGTKKAGKEQDKDITIINYKGHEFQFGYSKYFDINVLRVFDLLDKYEAEGLTDTERLELLSYYEPSNHVNEKKNKINGSTSFDTCVKNCAFCKKMKEIPGSICQKCYASKNEGLHPTARNRHALNGLIMEAVLFTEAELQRIPIMLPIARVCSFGDTPNKTYARNMLRIAKTHPWVQFGYWTKNIKDVSDAIKAEGKPENVSLIQSSCLPDKPAKKHEFFDYTFTVYSTKEATEAAIQAGAGACNGKHCDACGWKCYNKTHGAGVVDIAEKLRK